MYFHSIIIEILDKKNRIYEKEKFFFEWKSNKQVPIPADYLRIEWL